MWITSVKFPLSDDITQDSAGFVTHAKTWLEHVPASKRDTTRSDETLAQQFGYTADAVYVVDRACFPSGAGYLVDEADNTVYTIRRHYTGERTNTVELTCEVRENGKT